MAVTGGGWNTKSDDGGGLSVLSQASGNLLSSPSLSQFSCESLCSI